MSSKNNEESGPGATAQFGFANHLVLYPQTTSRLMFFHLEWLRNGLREMCLMVFFSFLTSPLSPRI